MNEAMMDVYKRYRLEPRGEYKRSSNSYLVAFDKKIETYVRQTDNPRRYMRFPHSEAAFAFLYIRDQADTHEASQT